MRLKLFSKIISFAVCMIFLCGCTDSEYFTPLSSDTSEKTVSVETLYDGILSSLLSWENASSFKGYARSEDAEKAVARIRNDYPEIFWINGFTTSSSQRSSEITIDVLNGYTSDELKKMSEELENAAETLLNKIPSSFSDFEKIILVHDNIIYNTVYDTSGASSENNGIWGTAYGCLVNGSATCQGYSDGFGYIMKLLDIPSGTVTGTAWSNGMYGQGNSGIQLHAWNYVTINGKSYWIDLTWDDPDDGNIAGSPIIHTYCLIDDERLLRTRKIDPNQENVPTCYSMDDNYFVRCGSYVTLYNSKTIGQILANSADMGEAEIMFADENTYNEALDMLFEQGELWELSDYAYISNEVNYTHDDNMYVLKIANN